MARREDTLSLVAGPAATNTNCWQGHQCLRLNSFPTGKKHKYKYKYKYIYINKYKNKLLTGPTRAEEAKSVG